MTKVTYTAGGSSYDAEYEYDGNAQLTKLLDWIDAVDGLEYAYDAAGRLTQLTDYDGSTLDYARGAAPRADRVALTARPSAAERQERHSVLPEGDMPVAFAFDIASLANTRRGGSRP